MAGVLVQIFDASRRISASAGSSTSWKRGEVSASKRHARAMPSPRALKQARRVQDAEVGQELGDQHRAMAASDQASLIRTILRNKAILRNMITKRVTALKLDLDRLAARADDAPKVSDASARNVFEEALANFVNGGDSLLDQATKHLWLYYDATVATFEDDEFDDYGIPRLTLDADIWEYVTVSRPPTFSLGDQSEYKPGLSYFSFEGEVAWECEHGLQLAFEHGRRVCKVGPFDGHLTQAHAYGDLSLLPVVFKA